MIVIFMTYRQEFIKPPIEFGTAQIFRAGGFAQGPFSIGGSFEDRNEERRRGDVR
jgi:hypothetical protein